MKEKTRQVGLIGWPIKHSLSPAMHNAAFAALGLDWTYVLLPTPAGQLTQALEELLAGDFVGSNVTMPHKREVLAHLDGLSDAARLIGAVNTIHVQDGKMYGENTDAIGFLNALKENGHDPKGMRVAMLGAGGAARAALFSLLQAGAGRVTVINRTVARGVALVEDLAQVFPDSSLSFAPVNDETLAALQGQVDLVVNSTSIGMLPQRDASPWPAEVAIPRGAVFYDIVYYPVQTQFLRRAQEAGQETVNGLGMMVHQGAAAFEIWTGQKAPLETMRQVCLRELGLDS